MIWRFAACQSAAGPNDISGVGGKKIKRVLGGIWEMFCFKLQTRFIEDEGLTEMTTAYDLDFNYSFIYLFICM